MNASNGAIFLVGPVVSHNQASDKILFLLIK